MPRLTMAILLAPLLLGSCHDLGAVSAISTKLVAASSTWDEVGQALEDSCQRTSAFNPQLDCKADTDAAAGIAGADAVLRAYFNAVGDAANAQNFTVQPGLDALSGSVANIPGINTSEVSAAAGLAGFLISLATEAAREQTIQRLIARAPQARLVIGVLQRTVGGAVAQTLRAEQIQLGAGFKTYILTAGTTVPADLADVCSGPGPRSRDFSGPTFLMATEYCRRLAIIRAELAALDNYDATLKAADTALAELASAKSELRGKALVSHVYSLGKQLDSDIAAVRSAFGRGASA